MTVDAQVVSEAMAGSREAFARLAEQRIAHLYGTAALILGNAGEADEPVQEALIRCWRSLPSLRDPEKFDAWLYRLLVRACYDELRKRKQAQRFPSTPQNDEQASAPDHLGRIADSDELSEPLRRLTANQRAILVLLYYRGHTVSEAAEILGVRIGTVKSRLHRSLRSLRRALISKPTRPSERKALP